jgi:hypothetical protein
MTDIKKGDLLWNTWRTFLLDDFERRMEVMKAKGYLGAPARKTFTALFLQVKGFKVPASDVLREATGILKERAVSDSRFDNIALMGHRIGMVENISDLKQYLQDVYRIFKPAGQVLITSLDMRGNNEPVHMSHQRTDIKSGQHPEGISMQFQQENLISPYYSLLRIKSESLKSQVAVTNWQCEIIHQENDSNFLARLTTSESV